MEIHYTLMKVPKFVYYSSPHLPFDFIHFFRLDFQPLFNKNQIRERAVEIKPKEGQKNN